MFKVELGDGLQLGLIITLIVSVLHLARQVYLNTRAVRSGNRQSNLVLATKVYASVVNDSVLCHVFRKGLNDIGTLSQDEKVRMHYFLHNLILLFQDSQNGFDEGTITEAEYDANHAAVLAVLQMPGGRVWWQDAQNAYSSKLREVLNLKSDACYSLADIYPYFIVDDNVDGGVEENDEQGLSDVLDVLNKGSSTNEQKQDAVLAANDDTLSTTEPKVPTVDWRRGRARRRTRQNYIS